MSSSKRSTVPNLNYMSNLMKSVTSHNDRMDSKKKKNRSSVSTKDISTSPTENNVGFYQDIVAVEKEEELTPELYSWILNEIARMRQMTKFHLQRIPGIGAIAKVLFDQMDRMEEECKIDSVQFVGKNVRMTELNAIVEELGIISKKIDAFSSVVDQFIEEKEKEKLAKTDPVKDFQNLHLSDAKKIPSPPVKDQVTQHPSSAGADVNMNVFRKGSNVRPRVKVGDAVPPRRHPAMMDKKE